MDHDLPKPPLALVVLTQALLAALLLGGIGVIALLPAMSASIAAALPEYASLRTPLLALAIAIVLLALVTLAMVALLVQRIHAGTVLARPSLLWVDVIVSTLICAAALVVVAFVVIGVGQAGSPWLALILVTACLALTALACITLVLRSLLGHAIRLRTELDEVV
ncbi:DUF2975 domain-containing protein [Microbacterium paludicola]|uniref:DUF2975 domain-containing protein n=1 Tax=Microbacterium paludicola TaxID=300019 RepID=A0A4Y9FXB4_9MICO|nr:DUF2975 domain-containing protein [Microbacterium paludicola]MBF0815618.1 DUF2975 domain-containing protein [Microbacterium paludicola]TFU33674.1 DUF2975 domain-containing protein [Microbacterium paludicola]